MNLGGRLPQAFIAVIAVTAVVITWANIAVCCKNCLSKSETQYTHESD